MKRLFMVALKTVGLVLVVLAAFTGFVWVQGVQYTLAFATWSWSNPLFDSAGILPEDNCGGASPCGSGPIRVLTYNILCRVCTSGDNKPEHEDWDERLPHLRALIEDYAPDLIGHQEVGGWKDIQELNIAPEKYVPVTHTFGPWAYGDAVLLYNSERFDLVDSGQFWLAPDSSLPFAFGWQTLSMPRYICWAHLRQKTDGFEFLFLNTHFDNNTPNKEPSALLANKTFGPHAARLPVIFTGDFNTSHETERYRNLLTGGDATAEFVNAADLAPLMEELPPVEGMTPAQTGTPLENLDHLIDHILLAGDCGKTVNRWVVDRRGYGPQQLRASDHPAVFAEVSFSLRP